MSQREMRKRERRIWLRKKKYEKRGKKSENNERGVLEFFLSYPHAPSKNR